jgi:hypothetical protein
MEETVFQYAKVIPLKLINTPGFRGKILFPGSSGNGEFRKCDIACKSALNAE